MDSQPIFKINSPESFLEMALRIFNFQAVHNPVYAKYISTLRVSPESVKRVEDIPFLPIEFFKSHSIITENEGAGESSVTALFESSGTTGAITSKHKVTDVAIYEQSFRKGFAHFYGNIEDYCVIALLPSYLEREQSSLTFMVNDLIKKSKHAQSGFYLYNHDELLATLKELSAKKQKTILMGVSFALLDLADKYASEKGELIDFSNITIMETGGMKGKRKEMIREELHQYLCERFRTSNIHSEYGMTELLSQAYSNGRGVFACPPWMSIVIRDVNDPFTFLPANKSGGVNVIDLANINSCSFIATQDLGKRHSDGVFEILGRFDNSDIRGCNLMIE